MRIQPLLRSAPREKGSYSVSFLCGTPCQYIDRLIGRENTGSFRGTACDVKVYQVTPRSIGAKRCLLLI